MRKVIEPTVRGARRAMFTALPTDRRVKGLGGSKGRGALQARKLIAPLFQRPVTLVAPDGLRLRVTADPVDEQIAQHLLGPRRTEYFPAWPGMQPHAPCILDLGAHHGLYAAAALHTYEASRVICVEPSAAALPALEANLAINGFQARARVVNTALASQSGHSTLRHTHEGTWGHSLFEDEDASIGSESVSLATLTDILQGDEPQIVKCNAEGAEYSLFDQIEASRLRPLLMVVMVHPDFGDLDRLLGQAKAMGYRIVPGGTPDHPAFQMWHHTVDGTSA
jgi:FkbM family methyltransferase